MMKMKKRTRTLAGRAGGAVIMRDDRGRGMEGRVIYHMLYSEAPKRLVYLPRAGVSGLALASAGLISGRVFGTGFEGDKFVISIESFAR